jgi:hypothetical protein
MTKPKTIVVDGVTYYSKSNRAEKLDGLEYKIVRCDQAGVFAGYIESEEGDTVVMRQARRLWYWDGAASLSQLAEEGVSKPENCKFPKEVTKIKLFGVIEIIDATKKAQDSISGVAIWKQ